jgi:hypothetical protein
MAATVRQLEAEAELVLGGLYPLDPPPPVTISWTLPRISHTSQLIDGLTGVPRRYAVLGQWVVGSADWGVAPSDGAQQMGAWGDTGYVGGSGNTLTPPAVITVTWPAPREAVAVTVAADDRWPGKPTAWSAVLKLSGTTVATVTGGGHHRQTVQLPSAPVLADQLIVTITGWTQGERVRVVEASAVDTVRWTGSQLVSVSHLQEVISEAGELSADETAVQVLGTSDLPELEERLMRQPARLQASVGPAGLDLMHLPPMWTRSARRQQSGRLDLRAEDVVSLLIDREFAGLQPTQNISVGDVVRAILADIPSSLWVVDTALDSEVLPWASLPAQRVRPALAALVVPLDLTVLTDSAGRLVVRRLGTPSSWLTISPSDVYAAERPIDDQRLATRVVVRWGPLQLASSAQLAQWSGTLSGQQVISLSWADPARNRSVQLTGCTLVSTIEDSPCRWAGKVSGSGAASITVSGQVLQRQFEAEAVAEDELATIRYGERVLRIDHLLVQSQPQAQALADRLLAERKSPRSRLVLDWRGDLRLEPGDGISWQGDHWVIERIETRLEGRLTQRLVCIPGG